MPILLISCRVEDAATGQRALDDDRETRRAYGAGEERLYGDVADPTALLVSIAWDSEERARLYARSDDLWSLLSRAGSPDPHHVWLLNDDGSAMPVRR
jgi:hypothetical protein